MRKIASLLVLLMWIVTSVCVEADSSAKTSDTAPVIFGSKELFRVASVSEFTAEERAKLAAELLTQNAKSPLFRTDKMVVRDDDNIGASMIFSGENLEFICWHQDAVAAGKDQQVLAAERLEIVRSAIDDYRKSYTKESLIKGCIFAVIATLILLLGFFILNRVKTKEEAIVRRIFAGKKLFKLVDGDGVISINGFLMRLTRLVLL